MRTDACVCVVRNATLLYRRSPSSVRWRAPTFRVCVYGRSARVAKSRAFAFVSMGARRRYGDDAHLRAADWLRVRDGASLLWRCAYVERRLGVRVRGVFSASLVW